jgi:hypothetical protein
MEETYFSEKEEAIPNIKTAFRGAVSEGIIGMAAMALAIIEKAAAGDPGRP